jgi:hypothetical protein
LLRELRGNQVAYLILLAKRKYKSIKRHILFPLAKSNEKESSGIFIHPREIIK